MCSLNTGSELLDLSGWGHFIVLVPGQIPCLYSKNSVSSGMKGGYLAACGVFIGDAVLMFLAWAGVATLIKTTPILFNIVRYLGAFYLLYLGVKFSTRP